MKAITYHNYGDPSVLNLSDIKSPILTKNDSLIRNYASTVSSGDSRVRAARPWLIRLFYGLIKPKCNVMGQDFAGIVIRTAESSQFQLNDRIIGITGYNMGGHAEHVKITSKNIVAKSPNNWTLEESATLSFGGMTALSFLKQLPATEKGKILIHGASGAIGTYAVQLAKHMGYHVTAVCSTNNVSLMYELGADKVIDYKKQDFTTFKNEFDAVFTTVGKTSYTACQSIMKKHATYISSDTPFSDYIRQIFKLKGKHHQLKMGVGHNTVELLEELVQLAEAGHISPVIDRIYTVDQAIEAHQYVDTGHKVGAVVLTF